MSLQQRNRAIQHRIDLYEVEMDIFFKETATVLNRIQKYGEIKEERYVWGKDGYNRPRRRKLLLSIVIPRNNVKDFKMRITKLDQALSSTIQYRKIATLV